MNDFFLMSDTEKKDRDQDGFCNFEITFKNAELPSFSDNENEYLVFWDFEDFHEIDNALAMAINDRDADKK